MSEVSGYVSILNGSQMVHSTLFRRLFCTDSLYMESCQTPSYQREMALLILFVYDYLYVVFSPKKKQKTLDQFINNFSSIVQKYTYLWFEQVILILILIQILLTFRSTSPECMIRPPVTFYFL